MAYARKRGNQIVIVHGDRDRETRRVQQRTLFTIYSKPEAREILGRGHPESPHQFETHLERQYPSISFDWKKIRRGIRENFSVLPEHYSYREERLSGRFKDDLRAFARQIMLADPRRLESSAELLREHRDELGLVADVIHRRLRSCDEHPNEWNHDNPFYWRFSMPGDGPPDDVEELCDGYLERGELDRAESGFRFLTECFDGYADGHNYLGVIALQCGGVEIAVERFAEAMRLGRLKFPRRIAKSRYWTDLDTRPYVRALQNYAYALELAGRHDDALAACETLEEECGDEDGAAYQRAVVFLNSGRWAAALEAAMKASKSSPADNLVAAFSLFELDRREMALEYFLHGAINAPRTTRILLRLRSDEPVETSGVRDHNHGVERAWALEEYLEDRGARARQFFRRVMRLPQVEAILDEAKHAGRRSVTQRAKGHREAFDRLGEMRSFKYARARAQEIAPLVLRDR